MTLEISPVPCAVRCPWGRLRVGTARDESPPTEGPAPCSGVHVPSLALPRCAQWGRFWAHVAGLNRVGLSGCCSPVRARPVGYHPARDQGYCPLCPSLAPPWPCSSTDTSVSEGTLSEARVSQCCLSQALGEDPRPT